MPLLTKKTLKITWVIVLVFVGLIVAVAFTNPKPVEQIRVQTTPKSGLGITREFLIKEFGKKENGGYVFEPRKSDPNSYIAIADETLSVNSVNTIELIGSADNLQKVILTSLFNRGGQADASSLIRIVGDITVIEPNAGDKGWVLDWVMSEIDKINKNPEKPYSNAKTFGNKKFQIVRDGAPKLTIKISPRN